MMCQSQTHEVSKLGKELFTKVIHKTWGAIAAGVTETCTDEFIAPEDMYLVGVLWGKTECTSGGQCICVLQRSGTYRELGSYTTASELESDDFVLFAWRSMGETITSMDPDSSRLDMLPHGYYFFLEKGERIYLHNSTKNNSAGSLNYAHDCVLIYTKTKP